MTSPDELKKTEQRGYSRGYAAGLRFGKHHPTTPPPLDVVVDLPNTAAAELPDDARCALQRGFERGFPVGVKSGQFKAARRKVHRSPVSLPMAPERVIPALLRSSEPPATPSAAPSVQEATATALPVAKGSTALLFEGLASSLGPAAAEGRLHQWEATAHSIVDIIADRHRSTMPAKGLPP